MNRLVKIWIYDFRYSVRFSCLMIHEQCSWQLQLNRYALTLGLYEEQKSPISFSPRQDTVFSKEKFSSWINSNDFLYLGFKCLHWAHLSWYNMIWIDILGFECYTQISVLSKSGTGQLIIHERSGGLKSPRIIVLPRSEHRSRKGPRKKNTNPNEKNKDTRERTGQGRTKCWVIFRRAGRVRGRKDVARIILLINPSLMKRNKDD